MRAWFCATLSALLCACAGTRMGSARIPRLVPAGPEQARLYQALACVYVTAEEPAPPKIPLEGLIGQLAQGTAEAALGRVPGEDLAGEAARALRRAGAPAAIYRTLRPGEADPYPAMIKPSATLRLRADAPTLEEIKTVQKVQRRDSKGRLVTVEVATWRRTGRLAVHGELSSGGRPLARLDREARITEERSTEPDGRRWLRQVSHDLALEGGRQAVAALGLRTTVAVRAVYPGARAGSWQELWDRAVREEQDGRPAEAVRSYAAARESAASDPQAAAIAWKPLLDELSAAVPSACDRSWFEPRLAVLPFSDETTSVDGPVVVRRAFDRMLSEGGYDTVPLDEVDQRLRDHGFTEGGQLAATTPDALAGWLGAQRLVFGNLEYYQLLPAGVVSGEISVWDAQAKQKIWTADASAAAVGDREMARAALKRLSGESWSTVLLLPAPETLRFLRTAAGGLPLQAPLE